jgi:hypothetical protein
VSGADRITCGAAHVDSVVDDFAATFKSGDPDSVSSYVATSDEGHLWLYTPGASTRSVDEIVGTHSTLIEARCGQPHAGAVQALISRDGSMPAFR